MRALVLSVLSLAVMTQVPTAHAQAWRHPFAAPTSSSQSSVPSSSQSSVSSVSSVKHTITVAPKVQSTASMEARLKLLGTGEITRSEFVGMLIDELYTQAQMDHCYSDIASTRPPHFTKLFADVRTTDKNAKQICLAMRDGILKGYRDGTYRPDSPITFAEASKLIARAYVLAPYGETATAVGPWYGAYVDSLSMHKAIPMTINNLNQKMTAADTAEILRRLSSGTMSLSSRTYGELDRLTYPPRVAYTGTSRTTQIIKSAASSSVKSMKMQVSSVQVSSKKSSVSSAGASSKKSSAMSSAAAATKQASSESESKWLKWY